jgi:hypothetical protein
MQKLTANLSDNIVSLRHFGVSVAWTILLFIILLGIYSPSLSIGSNFSFRFSLQYFMGFGLLSFSICSSLKKQMSNNSFRRNAFQLSAIVGTALLILVEVIAMNIYPDRSMQWFWTFCGFSGIGTGLIVFRLLYDACC